MRGEASLGSQGIDAGPSNRNRNLGVFSSSHTLFHRCDRTQYRGEGGGLVESTAASGRRGTVNGLQAEWGMMREGKGGCGFLAQDALASVRGWLSELGLANGSPGGFSNYYLH